MAAWPAGWLDLLSGWTAVWLAWWPAAWLADAWLAGWPALLPSGGLGRLGKTQEGFGKASEGLGSRRKAWGGGLGKQGKAQEGLGKLGKA